MKTVNVIYQSDGKIASSDAQGVFFEGENLSIQILAQFPSGMQIDSIKAYIRTNSGVQSYVVPTLADGKYSVNLTDEQLEKGMLKIGFEVKSGEQLMRFTPLVLNVDGFISDDYVIANKLYTVSVCVDETQTLESTENASVENTGTNKDVKLKFKIPKGAKGDKGDTGANGNPGAQTSTYILCAPNTKNKEGGVVVDSSTSLAQYVQDLVDSDDFVEGSEILIRIGFYGHNSSDTDITISKRCMIRYEGRSYDTLCNNIYINCAFVTLDNICVSQGITLNSLTESCSIKNCTCAYLDCSGNGNCITNNRIWHYISFGDSNNPSRVPMRNMVCDNYRGILGNFPNYEFFCDKTNCLLDNIIDTNTQYELSGQVKKYGARRRKTSSSPALERIWNAAGLTAKAGVDTTKYNNSFDNIYPWSHIRRCNISVNNNKIIVNAYEGEPTYKTDGTNGHVAVEIPEFYYCPPDIDGDNYEVFGVSEFPIGGWFKSEKMYVGAYTASINSNNTKFETKSGAFSFVDRSRTYFRNLAHATDSLCGLMDLQALNALQILFTVEFATLDSQSVMMGLTALPYSSADKYRAQVSETSVNRIIVINEAAESFTSGQTINIGTAAYGADVANKRIITSIETYDDAGKAVYFNGDAVEITEGDYISSDIWINGASDNIKASSGSAVSNSDGKHPFKYRGIENLWGNIYQWIDGININEYRSYVCADRNSYADNKYDGRYIKLNYVNSSSSGYLKELGYDERYPWARMPIVAVGSSSTYYSDSYQPKTGEMALCHGGYYFSGVTAGLWNSRVNARAIDVSNVIGVRLCWRES